MSTVNHSLVQMVVAGAISRALARIDLAGKIDQAGTVVDVYDRVAVDLTVSRERRARTAMTNADGAIAAVAETLNEAWALAAFPVRAKPFLRSAPPGDIGFVGTVVVRIVAVPVPKSS